MEKRRAVGLRGYFTRTLLLFFVGIVCIFLVTFLLLDLGMEAGVFTPANAGETEAAAEIARQREAGAFTGDLTPGFYNYIYFDASGQVAAASLQGEALTQEIARYADDNVAYGTGTYVFYEDGSRCLFTWRYIAAYTNPTLQRLLPNVELLGVLLAAAGCVLFFLLFIRRMGRRLGGKLALVETASEQIAGQDLDTPIDTAAGIREFNAALQSMEDMRAALKEALLRQWTAQAQWTQEVAALAHDLRTPLTVVNGNAELLLEDALNGDQQKLARAILGAGTRAQAYVAALQQLAGPDDADEAPEPVDPAELLRELDAAIRPLARQKDISLTCTAPPQTRPVPVRRLMLLRALVNIGENAVRYTEAGGRIQASLRQTAHETVFCIQDEGPGFSAEALLHGKEMFWQQDKSRRPGGSYGLGLAIVEKAAVSHGGSLRLENTAHGARVLLLCRGSCAQV